MATKSKKSTKNNKNLIAGICVAVAAVVAIVAIVLAVVLNRGVDDSYFVSDDKKYVLTMEGDVLGAVEEEDIPAPVKTHMVYDYAGDEITGFRVYYEYEDKDAAKKAHDKFVELAAESEDNEFGEISLDGKYVVFTASEDDYKDLTASDVKEQIEYMEMLKGMNFDDIDTSDVEEDVEVEEEVVEE